MPLRGGRPYRRDPLKRQVLGVVKRQPSTCPNGRCEHPSLLHDAKPGTETDACTVMDCHCGEEEDEDVDVGPTDEERYLEDPVVSEPYARITVGSLSQDASGAIEMENVEITGDPKSVVGLIGVLLRGGDA